MWILLHVIAGCGVRVNGAVIVPLAGRRASGNLATWDHSGPERAVPAPEAIRTGVDFR
jgi:hypothetical protein